MNKKLFGIIFAFVLIVGGFVSSFSTTVIAETPPPLTPKITSFSPVSGKIGDTIIINGQNFTDVKKVFFGSVDAGGFYNIDSPTKISVIVPKGAVSNKITLSTDKESIDSPMVFTVTNNSLNINLTTTNIDYNSVTLKATGYLNTDSYEFFVYDINNLSLGEILIDSKKSDIINSAQDRVVTFSGLKSGNSYIAKLKVNNLTYSTKFMTTKNMSDLNGMIKVVSDRLDQPITEGKEPGQYKVGSKAKLQTALTAAEHLNGDIAIYTQSDIDIATRDLKNALDLFELSKVGSIVVTQTASDPNFDIKNNGIVPRCNVGPIDQKTGNYVTPCDFNFFMQLVNNVIKYLLFVIATPLIALIIMYTAYLYLTAGGNSGQVEKVKHILFNAVIGYVVALGAWLIINTIITSLNVDKDINTFMDRIDKVE